MTNHENAKIIAFVGLAGSGKSAAVEYLTSKGFPKVYFGGVIFEAMKEADIEITPESEATFKEEIRQKEGNDFVVKRIIKEIHDLIEAGQHKIVADGIYSWTEYKAMKHEFPKDVTVIALLAPKHLRHHRLAERKERPFTDEETTQKDWSEIENLEKGGPIAMADYFIMNDQGVDELHLQLDKILKEVNFYS